MVKVSWSEIFDISNHIHACVERNYTVKLLHVIAGKVTVPTSSMKLF